MIISKTPFRISFFGGGTDYPAWYHNHDGAVLSTSIDKYCYITCRYLPPFFEHKHRIIYSLMEQVKDVSEIRHPAVRGCLKFLNIREGLEIHHDGDLPARTGLGSSSSFTVGLLNALYALKGIMISKENLAQDAIHVEQDMLKENVGSQDQIAAACGGFNIIRFYGKNKFRVDPVTINVRRLNELQDNLMLFFTGFSRYASDIAAEQVRVTPRRTKEMKEMLQMVSKAIEVINGRAYLSELGKLMHESWQIKRGLTKRITTQMIDEIYAQARQAGAVGGKLLGAGGGGFMLFYVKRGDQNKVKDRLKRLLHVPFRFENLGSQIIFYSPAHKIRSKTK
ncbi:MAG: kinase [Omnitrophica bacterium RIFCSPLOWO2_01_FULL_45_10]|nr:MAG: kinase [Omnitrophica bacterium RIFCSPLOWO2_01_FULL_45_10]